jgi:putative endonuclease
MSESQSLGQKGEAFAAEYLQKKGFKIRHRNWISGKHEVDIVAENKDFIVFVEVKTRSEDLVDARDLVSREKQRSIVFVADTYIRRYGLEKESRFDVIVLINEDDKFRINHIEDAFYPTLR